MLNYNKLLLTLFTALLVIPSDSLSFQTKLKPNNHRCFYQTIDYNTKYKFDVFPLVNDQNQSLSYAVKMDYLDMENNEEWNNFYKKQNVPHVKSTNIHKLTSHATTYRFCVANQSPASVLGFHVSISAGYQLIQLHLLPENTDAENLLQSLYFLEQQKKYLLQSLTSKNDLQQNQQYNVMPGNAIYSVILVSIVIFIGNLLVYYKISRILKSRKTI